MCEERIYLKAVSFRLLSYWITGRILAISRFIAKLLRLWSLEVKIMMISDVNAIPFIHIKYCKHALNCDLT